MHGAAEPSCHTYSCAPVKDPLDTAKTPWATTKIWHKQTKNSFKRDSHSVKGYCCLWGEKHDTWNIWFYTFIYDYGVSKSVSKCPGNVYSTQDSLREWKLKNKKEREREWKCQVQKEGKIRLQLREHDQPSCWSPLDCTSLPLLLAKRRAYYIVCSGCLIKMTLAGWLKQHKFLSRSYEVWEVQNQGAGGFSC